MSNYYTSITKIKIGIKRHEDEERKDEENKANSPKMYVEVDKKGKIKEIKDAIQKQHNISVKYQRLIFNGEMVYDSKLLFDYNISDGSELTLIQVPEKYICHKSGRIIRDPCFYYGQLYESEEISKSILCGSLTRSPETAELKVDIKNWVDKLKNTYDKVNWYEEPQKSTCWIL